MAGFTPHIQDRRQGPGQRPGPQYTARAYRVADPAITTAAPGTPIPFILSTPGVKRDGLNLATLPFLLDNYRSNPVVLPFHSYLDFPIGRGEIETLDTPAGQALYALASFDIKDPLGELADRKYRDGYLFAVSLGWDDVDDRGVPVRISNRRGVARDVLEFSVVSVPADTSALIDEGGRGGHRGLEHARSRAFLAEARCVLVASDPRADALDDVLQRLAACSGPNCDLLLADARQQLQGSGERNTFALGAPDFPYVDATSTADEPLLASESDEAPTPDSTVPADEASAEARRRAAMAAMVAAVWVDNADEADDKAPESTHRPRRLTSITSTGLAESYLGEDLSQGQHASQRWDLDHRPHTVCLVWQPAGLAPRVSFHVRPILRYQHVLPQRWMQSVARELETAIVGLGGRREHFDDDHGIQQGVFHAILEGGFAADHRDVRIGKVASPQTTVASRIGVEAARGHAHP